MPYKVYFSPQFNRDLGEIWDYISEEYKDPDLADQITDGLITESETLKELPMRGSKVLLPNGMDTGYRFGMQTQRLPEQESLRQPRRRMLFCQNRNNTRSCFRL